MIKKFSLALIVLLGASSVPVQATTWTVTKNSAKVLVAALLVWSGSNAVMNAVSPKARKKMHENFDKIRAEGRERVKQQGGNVEQYDEIMEANARVVSWMPAVTGVIGTGMTLGGLWLGYRGLSGLFGAEAIQEQNA